MCRGRGLASVPVMTTPQDNPTQDSELTLDPETIDDLDAQGDDAVKGGMPHQCSERLSGC
jgi:hypothetical protein